MNLQMLWMKWWKYLGTFCSFCSLPLYHSEQEIHKSVHLLMDVPRFSLACCYMEQGRKNDKVAFQAASSLLLHIHRVLWLFTLIDWQKINTSISCLFIPQSVWQNWFIWNQNCNLYRKVVAFQIEVVKIVLYWKLNGWDHSLCISLTLLL